MSGRAEAAAAKELLRSAARERLTALDESTRRAAGARVLARTLAAPELTGSRGVFTCLSFGLELDTWPLVDALLAARRPVYVPRADPRDGTLHVHPYPCELVTLSFGLRQPRRDQLEVPAEEVDRVVCVALVLGLAFDARGFRLGYGSGYFDRFLAGRPFPALGLAFGAQLLERLPDEPHDVPMRRVITEDTLP
jgi:5-formyltetrahydrofolate cyclo-ligase